MKKRSLIFIIPAVLLVGVLGYALINALSIYIPQEQAQNSYRELKESVRITSTTGAADVPFYMQLSHGRRKVCRRGLQNKIN